jgi:hypothetical protein
MTLRQRIAANVDADQQVRLEFLHRDFNSIHHAGGAAVDVDQ